MNDLILALDSRFLHYCFEGFWGSLQVSHFCWALTGFCFKSLYFFLWNSRKHKIIVGIKDVEFIASLVSMFGLLIFVFERLEN